MNLWIIFLTGLTLGGLSCMAMQGGLLASVVAARGGGKRSAIWPTVSFLVARFIIYTFLGMGLGAFGEALSLSTGIRMCMQILAGLYMLAVVGNMLNLHPLLRYIVISPPRFLLKKIRNESRGRDIFAPFLVGLATVLIPCGTTLSMEVLAISSGSPLRGGAIMGAFILGTTPIFLGLGVVLSRLGNYKAIFSKVVAAGLFYMAITSLNGAANLAGFPVTLQKAGSFGRDLVKLAIDPTGSSIGTKDKVKGASSLFVKATIVNGVQIVNVDVYPNKYNPRSVEVNVGEPVRFNLNSVGGIGCTQVFVIPKLGISKQLSPNQTTAVDFTPKETGEITWTCGMGMYTGTIKVL